MSNAWHRIGKQPGDGTGLDAPALPPAVSFHLAFRSPSGREEITHNYNQTTFEFDAVKATNVVVTNTTSLFRIQIQGVAAMEISGGNLKLKKFSERAASMEPSVLFRMKDRNQTYTLGTLTKSGMFSVGLIHETDDLGEGNARFQFFSDSSLFAVLGKSGLKALSLLEIE